MADLNSGSGTGVDIDAKNNTFTSTLEISSTNGNEIRTFYIRKSGNSSVNQITKLVFTKGLLVKVDNTSSAMVFKDKKDSAFLNRSRSKLDINGTITEPVRGLTELSAEITFLDNQNSPVTITVTKNQNKSSDSSNAYTLKYDTDNKEEKTTENGDTYYVVPFSLSNIDKPCTVKFIAKYKQTELDEKTFTIDKDVSSPKISATDGNNKPLATSESDVFYLNENNKKIKLSVTDEKGQDDSKASGTKDSITYKIADDGVEKELVLTSGSAEIDLSDVESSKDVRKLIISACDKAENKTESTYYFKFDKDAPELKQDKAAEYLKSGMTSVDHIITLIETASGLKNITLKCSKSDNSEITYTYDDKGNISDINAPKIKVSDSTITITFTDSSPRNDYTIFVEDNAGNKSNDLSFKYYLDRTAPTFTVKKDGDTSAWDPASATEESKYFYKSDTGKLTINAEAQDKAVNEDSTGVEGVYYKLNDGEKTAFEGANKASIDLKNSNSKDGKNKIEIYAEDKAGNVSDSKVYYVYYDGAGPGINVSKPAYGTEDYYISKNDVTKSCTVSGSISDEGSGLRYVKVYKGTAGNGTLVASWYSDNAMKDSGVKYTLFVNETEKKFSIPGIEEAGTYTIVSEDLANAKDKEPGNLSNATFEVKEDNDAPVISDIQYQDVTKGFSSWLKRTFFGKKVVIIRFSVSDELSEIKKTEGVTITVKDGNETKVYYPDFTGESMRIQTFSKELILRENDESTIILSATDNMENNSVTESHPNKGVVDPDDPVITTSFSSNVSYTKPTSENSKDLPAYYDAEDKNAAMVKAVFTDNFAIDEAKITVTPMKDGSEITSEAKNIFSYGEADKDKEDLKSKDTGFIDIDFGSYSIVKVTISVTDKVTVNPDGKAHSSMESYILHKSSSKSVISSIKIDGKDAENTSGSEIYSYTTQNDAVLTYSVTAKLDDGGKLPGPYTVNTTFYKEGSSVLTKSESTDETEKAYSINVPSNFNGYADIVVTDFFGRVTEKNTYYFISDSAAPSISGNAFGENKYIEGNTLYVNGSYIDFSFTAKDNIGIKSLSVKLGSKEYLSGDELKSTNSDSLLKSYSFKKKLELTDAASTLTVTLTDVSGRSVSEEYIIHRSTHSALISNLKIDGTDISGSQTGYVYFTNNAANITFDVSAKTDDGVDIPQGINSVTYVLTDINGNAVQSGNASGELNKSNASYIIPVSKNFKGTVTVTVQDIFGRTQNGVQTSENFIIEKSDQHSSDSKIELSLEKEDGEVDGQKLFNNDTSVHAVVTDTASGIKSISYDVTAPYDKDNNYTSSEGFTTVSSEKNVSTVEKGDIAVKNNSNGIVVTVSMTDNAGNTKSESITLGIDKTAPSINITYDNNTNINNYYNADRTATVTVSERNFDPAKAVFTITNEHGTLPTISGWTNSDDATNPDASTHTCTVHFTADGDYTFALSVTDMVGNSASDTETPFTLDKTDPVIEVSLSGGNPSNGNYYNTPETATIKVTEHDFDPSGLSVNGTATDAGAGKAFPGVSGWTNSGDVHTTEIPFTTDGLYGFTVEFTDQAGNRAVPFTQSEFYVDQTIPEITFGGIANESANAGEVTPTVTFSDINYDRDGVSVQLTGANNGAVNYPGSYSDSANGQTFVYQNFAENQKVDDIYTLTATITDMAGNEFQDSITFSVNRFGSVYTIEDPAKSNLGKYVQKSFDVIVKETNVDALVQDKTRISMTKNDVPATLKISDFTVESSGGGNTWHQYTYTFGKDLFKDDGTYSLDIYSEDAAGNVNENINETKKAEIKFGIDGTSPIITADNLSDNAFENTDSYEAKFDVKDNMVLDSVAVYLNKKKVKASNSGDTYSFSIPESTKGQLVTVIATDAAGNQATYDVKEILISTNGFIRFYHNKPLFFGTIFGGLALIFFIIFLILRRKKDEDEDKGASA